VIDKVSLIVIEVTKFILVSLNPPSMGFWRSLLCFPKKESTKPAQAVPKPQPVDEDDDDSVYRSPICAQYNTLGLKETGYIDEPKLRAALSEMFKMYGPLDFGIKVRLHRLAPGSLLTDRD
jgi:hypothetical protein